MTEKSISHFISMNSSPSSIGAVEIAATYESSNLFRLNLTTFREITVELFMNKLYYVTQKVSKKYTVALLLSLG